MAGEGIDMADGRSFQRRKYMSAAETAVSVEVTPSRMSHGGEQFYRYQTAVDVAVNLAEPFADCDEQPGTPTLLQPAVAILCTTQQPGRPLLTGNVRCRFKGVVGRHAVRWRGGWSTTV